MGCADPPARVLRARGGRRIAQPRTAHERQPRAIVGPPAARHGRGLPLAGRQHHPVARRRGGQPGAGDGAGRSRSGRDRGHRVLHHAGDGERDRAVAVAARNAAVGVGGDTPAHRRPEPAVAGRGDGQCGGRAGGGGRQRPHRFLVARLLHRQPAVRRRAHHDRPVDVRRIRQRFDHLRPHRSGARRHGADDRRGQSVGLDQPGAQACQQPGIHWLDQHRRGLVEPVPQLGRPEHAAEPGRHGACTHGGAVPEEGFVHRPVPHRQEGVLRGDRCGPDAVHHVERGHGFAGQAATRHHLGQPAGGVQRRDADRLAPVQDHRGRLDLLAHHAAHHLCVAVAPF